MCTNNLNIHTTKYWILQAFFTELRITGPSLPKLDVYLYESYVNALPADSLYIDIVLLDASDNPVQKLFTAALPVCDLRIQWMNGGGRDLIFTIYK